MLESLFQKAETLSATRTPYALAIVVRHEKPISGKPGDKAIILADGSLTGWIGGGCTKPLIIAEAQEALRDGKHRLVRIAPSSQATVNGIIRYEMTCHSGGSLDIYIEPVLPNPRLVIFGRSELARTLCRLGAVMNYTVVVAAPEASAAQFPDADHFQDTLDLSDVSVGPPCFAVVATQGEHDAAALSEALARNIPHVAFVASREKAEETLKSLASSGIAQAEIARIKAPAGLDIGARLPAEIAVSVLADIVSVLRTAPVTSPTPATHTPMDTTTLQIKGMSCSHCVMVVQKTLEELSGITVRDVQVGSATIACDDANRSLEDVYAALQEEGFEARTLTESDSRVS